MPCNSRFRCPRAKPPRASHDAASTVVPITGTRNSGSVATGSSRTPERRCAPRREKSCAGVPRMLRLSRPRSEYAAIIATLAR